MVKKLMIFLVALLSLLSACTQQPEHITSVSSPFMVQIKTGIPRPSCISGSSWPQAMSKGITIELPDEDVSITLHIIAGSEYVRVVHKVKESYEGRFFNGRNKIYIYNAEKAYEYDLKTETVTKVLSGGKLYDISPDWKYIIYQTGAEAQETWALNRNSGEKFKFTSTYFSSHWWAGNSTFCWAIKDDKVFEKMSLAIYQCALEIKKTSLILNGPGQELINNHLLMCYKDNLLRLTDIYSKKVEEYQISPPSRECNVYTNDNETWLAVKSFHDSWTMSDISIHLINRSDHKIYKLNDKYTSYKPGSVKWNWNDTLVIGFYNKHKNRNLSFESMFELERA